MNQSALNMSIPQQNQTMMHLNPSSNLSMPPTPNKQFPDPLQAQQSAINFPLAVNQIDLAIMKFQSYIQVVALVIFLFDVIYIEYYW